MRACNRPKMALALATDTCCETMIAARPAKPGFPAAERRPSARRGQALDQFRVFGAQALGGFAQGSLIDDQGARMIGPCRRTAGAQGCAGRRLMHALRRHGR